VAGGFFAMLAGLPRAGNQVITCAAGLDGQAGWRRRLVGVGCLFTGLTPSLAVCEQRERDRGDRAAGNAAREWHAVHQGWAYDLDIDTGAVDPERAAALVLAAARRRAPLQRTPAREALRREEHFRAGPNGRTSGAALLGDASRRGSRHGQRSRLQAPRTREDAGHRRALHRGAGRAGRSARHGRPGPQRPHAQPPGPARGRRPRGGEPRSPRAAAGAGAPRRGYRRAPA
jgi:hypothetical protein